MTLVRPSDLSLRRSIDGTSGVIASQCLCICSLYLISEAEQDRITGSSGCMLASSIYPTCVNGRLEQRDPALEERLEPPTSIGPRLETQKNAPENPV